MSVLATCRRSPPPARRGWREPAVAFLRIGLPFGLAFALLMPPFSPPDENRHLTRAYLIAEGSWAPPGEASWARASLPRSFGRLQRAVRAPGQRSSLPLRPAEVSTLFRIPLQPEERFRIIFAGVYSPLPYLPAAMGIALGRLFGLPATALLLLGRITSLAACLALTAAAVRRMPRRGWALAVLALAPMTLAQFAAVSADGVTVALAFLFVACALDLAIRPQGRTRSRAVATLGALALLLGLAKPGYGVLALVPLAAAAGGPSERRLIRLASGVSLAALLLGNAASLVLAQLARVPPPSPGADPFLQLRAILTLPFDFLLVCLRTLAAGLPLYGREIVGYFGQLEAPLPTALVLAYGGLLLAAIATDGEDPPGLTPWKRFLLLALFAAGLLSVLLMAYLGWNRLGAPYVQGMQGRYLVPLLPLLLVACPSAGRLARIERRGAVLALGSATILACAVEVVVVHFYRL